MWLEREMVGWFVAGRADVDAFLAGEELPSVKAEQGRRLDTLLAAGGEMH